ncbi:MAG TPA: hypothetical protein VFQ84_04425 [Arenimonas sp.]|uniref:hypothetical protein n=1 Tax=Arenimonas sp. TaxID=1872635 RepID=UPI002D811655|nr:hypothetical protein [Arenimonas sp.]HEU0152574.1 hypothetical protein [Arenimonas sp.]
MSPTNRSRTARAWLLPLLALGVGVLGMVALWLAVYLYFRSTAGWLAVLAALDIVFMMRLAAAPAGRLRASLALAGTAAAIAASYWMMVATQMGLLLGLSPLESSQRLGPVLAGELVRHATSPWDIAWAALALALAWRLGR